MDSVQDLKKKYEGSWVPLRKDGELVVPLVDLIGMDGKGRVVMCAGNDNFLLREWEILPMCKSRVFEKDGNVVYFSHIPARQWKRGHHQENTALLSPLHQVYQNMKHGGYVNGHMRGVFSLSFSNSTFYSLYNTRYAGGIEAGIRRLLQDETKLGICLSREMWLSYNPIGEEYMLWRKTIPLAMVSAENRRLSLLDPLYHQEVTDFVRRSGDLYHVHAA
jgi:hypothetical protein